MKIATFKNLESDFDTIGEEVFESINGYVRTSEYVDVEFPPLPHEDVVTKQVNALEEAKKNIQAKAELQLTEIDRRIGELLALPN